MPCLIISLSPQKEIWLEILHLNFKLRRTTFIHVEPLMGENIWREFTEHYNIKKMVGVGYATSTAWSTIQQDYDFFFYLKAPFLH